MTSGARSTESSFLAGGFSSGVATIAMQPFDVLKTRLQQGSGKKMIPIFRTIVDTRGYSGLWAGSTATLIRVVPGVALYMSLLEKTQSSAVTLKGAPLSHAENFAVATLARSGVAVLLCPATVVKARMESSKYAYSGVISGLRGIYQIEGVRGLFAGVVPTVLRDAPFSGLYYAVFSALRHGTKDSEEAATRIAGNVSAGLVAGTVATVVTNPIDVVKTQMQLKLATGSTMDTVRSLWQAESIRGFAKGFVPRLLRRSVQATFTWAIYEEVMRALASV